LCSESLLGREEVGRTPLRLEEQGQQSPGGAAGEQQPAPGEAGRLECSKRVGRGVCCGDVADFCSVS